MDVLVFKLKGWINPKFGPKLQNPALKVMQFLYISETEANSRRMTVMRKPTEQKAWTRQRVSYWLNTVEFVLCY